MRKGRKRRTTTTSGGEFEEEEKKEEKEEEKENNNNNNKNKNNGKNKKKKNKKNKRKTIHVLCPMGEGGCTGCLERGSTFVNPTAASLGMGTLVLTQHSTLTSGSKKAVRDNSGHILTNRLCWRAKRSGGLVHS